MQEENRTVKCVDFGKLATNEPEENLLEEYLRVGNEVSKAFEDIGFVYLINHGIPDGVIEGAHESGSKFFSLNEETKAKYSTDLSKYGYVAINREILSNNKGIQEYRESFGVRKLTNTLLPKEIPGFQSNVSDLINHGLCIFNKLLKALEISLVPIMNVQIFTYEIELEPHTLLHAHKNPFFGNNNESLLRLLHYPPVPDHVQEGAVRCGAHTDYGTLTLLFQDNMGGLEVKDRSGVWHHADPIPGAILINVADLLEMWTSGKYVATEHRVLIPKTEIKRRSSRRSIALFMHADNDVLVKPFDGSTKYPPITAKQYLQNRYDRTYKY